MHRFLMKLGGTYNLLQVQCEPVQLLKMLNNGRMQYNKSHSIYNVCCARQVALIASFNFCKVCIVFLLSSKVIDVQTGELNPKPTAEI